MSEATKVDLKNGIHKIESIEDLVSITTEMYAKIGGYTHFGFELNLSSFNSYFSNPQRFKDLCCFGYFCDNELVSYIVWIKIYDARVNKKTIQEYMWVSDSNAKGYGVKLFKKSLEYIKNIYKFEVILVGNSEKNPKLEKFYKRNGFKLECDMFYKSN
mgnify:CR=1 FL=1|tara:strand:+ start:242 stop:715 length:474 start_codon:yes stop_codon:yes gene_type:complete